MPSPASIRNGHVWIIGGRTHPVHYPYTTTGQPFVPTPRGLILGGAEAVEAPRAQVCIGNWSTLLEYSGLAVCLIEFQEAIILSAFRIIAARHPVGAVARIDARRVHQGLGVFRLCLRHRKSQ